MKLYKIIKQKLVIIITIFSLIILPQCMVFNERTDKPIELINIDYLKLDPGSKIITIDEGYFKIDSNSVLPEYDSTLIDEYNIVKEMIESRSNFRLKSKWDNGNDSPSHGIWVEYLDDMTSGFYVIKTNEGHISIYGSSKESINKGIIMLESLFVPAFKDKSVIRDEWYLPQIIIEHKEVTD